MTTRARSITPSAIGGLAKTSNLSDLSSVATAIDNLGLVSLDNTADLATPAIVTRFRNMQGGRLYTRNFGIKHDMSADQSTQFQDFLNTCVAEKCTGVIGAADVSNGGIDCSGATIYLNSDGTQAGSALNRGFVLVGEDQRFSQVRNCALSVGTVFAVGGASNNVHLGGWYHTGCINLWTLENHCFIHDLRINVFEVSTGVALEPEYASDKPAENFAYMLLISESNHITLSRVRVSGTESSGTSDFDGAFMQSNGTLRWLGGGATGCRHGVIIGESGISSGVDNSPANRLEGLHFERCSGTHIKVTSANSTSIIGNHIRPDTTWTGTAIQIGDTTVVEASAIPLNTIIEGNWINGPAAVAGVGIDVQKATGVRINANQFTQLTTGISLTSAANVKEIDIGKTNNFTLNTTDLSNGALSQPARFPAGTFNYLANQDASGTHTVNCANGPHALIILDGAGRTMANPTDPREGERYTWVINKSTDASSITTWGDQFSFEGAAPDFLNMDADDYAVLTIDVVDPTNTGTLVLATTYTIMDVVLPKTTPTFTVATLPTASSWDGATAYVTDGDAALAWGDTVVNTGSGATPYLVWSNGTNWTVAGK